MSVYTYVGNQDMSDKTGEIRLRSGALGPPASASNATSIQGAIGYVQAIRRVARADGRVALLDRQAVMGDQSSGGNTLVGADKVHPNSSGHAAIAASLLSLIQAA